MAKEHKNKLLVIVFVIVDKLVVNIIPFNVTGQQVFKCRKYQMNYKLAMY